MAVKHAFVWWCLTNRGLNDMQILDAGQQAGFEGVEMVPEQHWAEVRSRGLTMVSTQAHASIESGLNDASQHQRIIDETTAKLEKAVKWGIPNLICFSGNRGGRNDFASIDAALTFTVTSPVRSMRSSSKVSRHASGCTRWTISPASCSSTTSHATTVVRRCD
jgi:sugar phosphate isomerase/epimerase